MVQMRLNYHAPSLGCDGMADKGAIVYVTENKNPKAKCKYVIYLSQVNDTIVGIHPKISEKLAHQILKNNNLPMIDEVNELKAEVTMMILGLILLVKTKTIQKQLLK